jgi:hypothetical protein
MLVQMEQLFENEEAASARLFTQQTMRIHSTQKDEGTYVSRLQLRLRSRVAKPIPDARSAVDIAGVSVNICIHM